MDIVLGIFAILAAVFVITTTTNAIKELNEENAMLRSMLSYTQLDHEEEIAMYQDKIDNYENRMTEYDDKIAGYEEYMTTIGVQKEKMKAAMNNPSPTVANSTITFNPNDITKVSNASPEALNAVLKGTRLEGYGWLYSELEDIYGINAIYAIANCFQESGYNGTNSMTARNNIYGLVGKSFNSVEECITYYFKLISGRYVEDRGLQSITAIGTVYCPDDGSWDDDIISIANKLHSKATATLS